MSADNLLQIRRLEHEVLFQRIQTVLQAWTAVSHLEGLRGLVDTIKRLVGLSSVSEGQEEWRTSLLPPVQRADQMAMLRAMAQDMEQLTSAIELIGGKVPSEAIPHVYAFFDLADAIIQ